MIQCTSKNPPFEGRTDCIIVTGSLSESSVSKRSLMNIGHEGLDYYH